MLSPFQCVDLFASPIPWCSLVWRSVKQAESERFCWCRDVKCSDASVCVAECTRTRIHKSNFGHNTTQNLKPSANFGETEACEVSSCLQGNKSTRHKEDTKNDIMVSIFNLFVSDSVHLFWIWSRSVALRSRECTQLQSSEAKCFGVWRKRQERRVAFVGNFYGDEVAGDQRTGNDTIG